MAYGKLSNGICMKISCLYSIFNRSELFARGLATIATQTFPRDEFEVIIIDDGSTEDLGKVYAPYIGKLNIRHIKYDHKLHPIWHEMNPDPSQPESWYHTQAISANIGINAAQGEVICISQPEMLHAPWNFEVGYARALETNKDEKVGKQIFCELWLADKQFNTWLQEDKWKNLGFDQLYAIARDFGEEWPIQASHIIDPSFPQNSYYNMYWYIEFFPKSYAMAVGGVDLIYQSGVYAEDDNFKVRMRLAGCPEEWGGRPNLKGSSKGYVVGIHQSHKNEGEKNERQNRDGAHWDRGQARNRAIWADFLASPFTVANDKLGYSPWGEFTIVEDKYHGIK